MSQLPLLPGVSQVYSQPAVCLMPLRDQPGYRVLTNSAACNTAELLAVIIGGSQPLDVALRLLTHFGSLTSVARATATELIRVRGVGQSGATRLKAALEISRRLLAPEDERRQINSPGDAAAVLQPILMHLDQEYLYVLLLDTRNRVIREPIQVYHGSLNTSLIRVGEVFRDAVRANAAAIIVSHNHPSGDPSPSPEDVAVTRAIVEAGKLLDIQLLDHLILGAGGRHVSLKERGLGFG